ncbi:nitroreductase family deazaflavin-dependent oxidoreductase [Mycobacterium intermedium]|uniref:Nitroreductase family deazaflavin-dependent oxidoreductase n=1 Tax=Mycobacterium intermedium TaxID=28445 RepID=A0A1E3S6V0_MYCIE|nr:nitroreductase family deazaflavin-dependent oxidoreductase [Mycobacterium intermedium]MCV6962234.1 nitroreductase family deazaflavin-dependent oxidoreductase [Mycobacterium intermedium]ODQ97791.1 peptidase [Mycobacterium intermedium]OPE49633.1 nitroreductase family deazaflavin-dependent oxidoreductase [Mycobacterium intermedium]ORA99320.1 nitroreductase family deazaflavin-dependent oxidoreductase [Mycobacterium intermedium]
MRLPQWLARFNKYVTNPVQRLWAGWIPLHGILLHVGRRSGKPYRTPLIVFSAQVDGQPAVAIMLTYGPNRDWLKNLKAAGGANLQRHGKTFGVGNPQVMTKAQAAQYVTGPVRRVFSVLPFEEAVLLTRNS